MIKVTLLGDSIRMGYGQFVPGLLGDNYTVFQPADNCKFAKFTLRSILDWNDDIEGSDIIHWNNGIWDITTCVDGDPLTDIDEYLTTMIRVAKQLKKRAKKVIFATTTPVRDPAGSGYESNARIMEYNRIVVPELQKLGIMINDLHSIVYPNVDKYVCDDNLHMNSTGYEALAKQVVKAIKEAENEI